MRSLHRSSPPSAIVRVLHPSADWVHICHVSMACLEPHFTFSRGVEAVLWIRASEFQRWREKNERSGMMTLPSDAVKWSMLNAHFIYKPNRHFNHTKFEKNSLNNWGDFITSYHRLIFINISPLRKMNELLTLYFVPYSRYFTKHNTSTGNTDSIWWRF